MPGGSPEELGARAFFAFFFLASLGFWSSLSSDFGLSLSFASSSLLLSSLALRRRWRRFQAES